MKFYDREKEKEIIENIVQSKGISFLFVKVLRRVGKTRLIFESLKNKKYVNIFVPKDKTASLFLEETSRELNIPLFTTVLDMFRYVFENNEIVFIDEFQNFYNVDKSVYSDIQKLYEEFKRKNKKLSIIVTGSSYSLIKKIFYDYAKALYGRKDADIMLNEFGIKTTIQICKDFGINDLEEQIKIWSVFGGMPKFYEMIEKMPQKTFNGIMKNWYLQIKELIEEGNSILVSEFGNSYKSYFSVMEAISDGKTKLSEISSVFANDKNSTNRYLDIIRNEYDLIMKQTPILEDPRKSNNGRYKLKNNFFHFWFSFIRKYISYYEQNRQEELYTIFNKKKDAYVGLCFEEFCINLMKNSSLFDFDKIGKQWGKFKGEKGKNTYEIDIVAPNEENKQILFAECKWKDNVSAEKTLEELKEKSSYVNWHNKERKEKYIIFAKSFKKKIRKQNLQLFDLKDIEKSLSK